MVYKPHKPITPDHKPVPKPKQIAGRGITKPKNAPFGKQRGWSKKDNRVYNQSYNAQGWQDDWGCLGCFAVIFIFFLVMCAGLLSGLSEVVK